jgi:hypothetical protein
MSASATEHRQAPPPDIDLAALPARILMNFIVLTLAPMLLTAAGADVGFARIAVLETIKAYQPRNQPDLIAIAQIVACGLAALGSLGLSMAGDLPLPMVLRLRGNATALNRVAEHNRRARPETTHHPAATWLEPTDAAYEAEVLTALAESEKRFADAQATSPTAEPAPPPAPPPAPIAETPIAETPIAETQVPDQVERRHQTAWAGSMINVAKSVTASLADLSPLDRKTAVLQIEALSRCANDLISGDDAPRLRPGALSAMIEADTIRPRRHPEP